jgi:hypothetical protein
MIVFRTGPFSLRPRPRRSAGDWTTYAAGYSRRKPAPTEDTKPALQHTGEPDAFKQLE